MIGLVSLIAATAAVDQSPNDIAKFAQSVRSYIEFTTPRCAPEEINPYRSFVARRDRLFWRSLKGTSLDGAYHTAIADQDAQERSTVFHCDGPPPPPPAPGSTARSIDPRSRAVEEAQKRLREGADAQPGVFDRGDALFAAMVAARDRALSGTP